MVSPDCSLKMVIIGGSPADVVQYRQRATSLGLDGRVWFLGSRPVAHLGSYLAQAHVLVSPRILGQNTPMKVYSYMQSGKAILATDIRSHTQALDATCAELVPAEPAALAAGLERLARDPRRRETLGAAAKDQGRAGVLDRSLPRSPRTRLPAARGRLNDASGYPTASFATLRHRRHRRRHAWRVGYLARCAGWPSSRIDRERRLWRSDVVEQSQHPARRTCGTSSTSILRRMRTSIRARREFCREFPHLARPLQCFMPLKVAGVRSPWTLGPALLLNDVISHDRNDGVAPSVRLPRGHLLGGARSRERRGGALGRGAVRRCGLVGCRHDGSRADGARDGDCGGRTRCRRGQSRAGSWTIWSTSERLKASPSGTGSTAKSSRCGPQSSSMQPDPGPVSCRTEVTRKAGFLPPGWIGGLNVVLRRSLGIETAVALSAASKEADRSAVLHRATARVVLRPVARRDRGRHRLPAGEWPGRVPMTLLRPSWSASSRKSPGSHRAPVCVPTTSQPCSGVCCRRKRRARRCPGRRPSWCPAKRRPACGDWW